MPITYPFLFGASFFGTKLVGLKDTVRAFEKVGRYQRKIKWPFSSPPSVEALEKKIARGYALVPLPIQCLDQSLVTWYLFNLHGHPANLKIGVSLTPLRSHAWVETEGKISGDVPGLADLRVVAEYQSWDEAKTTKENA
jgi:Transglutaminase-like superfamily